MTTAGKKLTEVAQRRLEVMQTLDALGVGFSIASHDMDIRGSGNILGDEQSGHVRETGIELYQDMLREEIENLKLTGEKIGEVEYEEDYSVQIKLGISLLIPEIYIPDLSLRMSLYKRIARIDSIEAKEQIATEIIDRFGPLPNETDNLLEIAYLKSLCKKCDIEKVETGSGGILISFRNNKFREPKKLLDYIFKHKDKTKLHGHKILFLIPITSEKEKFNNSLKVINQIEALL
jgi:transcription-repair coupling factor (superfamily II helicase)